MELAKNSLEEKVAQAETEINQINQLVVNVQQDVGDVSTTLNKTRDSIKNLRKCLDTHSHIFTLTGLFFVRCFGNPSKTHFTDFTTWQHKEQPWN